ncbi:hypothetical protein MT1_1359 [Pseudomonas sp. MT-1]|nr:hypothetical protein MT1_1359 [Pseudomonas sp. MT-1]
MQRKGDALILQRQARMLGTCLRQLALDGVEHIVIEGQVLQLAGSGTTLGAVNTGSGQLQRREQRIELADRPARHDRNRNAIGA